MAFFLVDLEFREKAKSLLTKKEIYFCFLFVIFAMVNWSSLLSLANSLFAASDEAASAVVNHSPHSPEEAAAAATDWRPDPVEAAGDGDTVCNHHNHHTNCFGNNNA